jgi:hypothetical protein
LIVVPDHSPRTIRRRLSIGHGMLGWTLAMGAGERAINLLLEA